MKIKAFSIMELLIVLAVSGLLIAFFFNAMQQFQGYLMTKSKETSRANDFLLFRSSLRSELFLADSIQIEANSLSIFSDSATIQYTRLRENQMLRESNQHAAIVENIDLVSIKQTTIGKKAFINLEFNYDDELFEIIAPKYPSVSNEVNTYFSKLP